MGLAAVCTPTWGDWFGSCPNWVGPVSDWPKTVYYYYYLFFFGKLKLLIRDCLVQPGLSAFYSNKYDFASVESIMDSMPWTRVWYRSTMDPTWTPWAAWWHGSVKQTRPKILVLHNHSLPESNSYFENTIHFSFSSYE